MKKQPILWMASFSLLTSGCLNPLVRSTDDSVYSLIKDRQQAGLGLTTHVDIAATDTDTPTSSRMYDFNPSPLDGTLPASFAPTPTAPPLQAEPDTPGSASQEESSGETTPALSALTESIFTKEQLPNVKMLNLQQSMAYAMRHGRALQDAKEDLYLDALDLTLERHLWTPQFAAAVQSNFTDFDEDNTLDRAMSTVSEISVSQRLPYGGDITARMIHSLVREVSDLVTKSESGQFIIDAQLPLLRGAGPIAFESRYRAERNVIYAVRIYERFRRTFLVSIASDYLDLQRAKASITNSYKSYVDRKLDWDKADFIERMGRSQTISEAPRAKANFRSAEASLVSAKEAYESSLDRFKIRLGMPVDDLLDVMDQENDESTTAVDNLLPKIALVEATSVAVTYRLDLLNDRDQIDDVRRGVVNARNQLLPDLDFSGSLTFDSDPNQLRSANLRSERRTWRGGVDFRIDDRKTERNVYRRQLVSLQRAQRDHEEFIDRVRADVRRALRQINRQQNLIAIQAANLQESQVRLDGARAQFDLGRSRTNQDVVDAENVLLRAKNDFARAVSDYRVAILEFRRDTGTLHIDDEGQWDHTWSEKSQQGSPSGDDAGG